MIDLAEENGKKSSLGAFGLRYSFELFFFFSTFNLFFNLFLCLVYVYICLSRLVLGFFHVFKHVRLLDLYFSILFSFSSVSVLIRFFR